MPTAGLEARIAAVRQFNRFYTQKIGVLEEGLVQSPYSLTEVRILYELSARGKAAASELSEDLGLDPGYLSRILKVFRRDGLVGRRTSKDDARRGELSLTKKGRETFGPIEARTRDAVARLLAPLPEGDQRRLVAAMESIGGLLRAPAPSDSEVVLRP